MAAADRVTPEAGKRIVPILAVTRRRALARQVGQDLPRGDRVAGGVAIGMVKEAAQEVRPGRELRAMSSSPEHIAFDRLAQDHARPSRSRAATSRSAARSTLA